MALERQAKPALDGVWTLVRALHEGGRAADRDHAEFVVLLVTHALFGEAIAGPTFRAEPPDAPDPAARTRFLARLTTLVRALLPPPPEPRRAPTRRKRAG